MTLRLIAVLFALSALCAAQVTHVQIDVGAPAQPGSITKGEELYITVNNSLPSAWFFFSITTTDTCGVDVANVTFPDGTMQELYWKCASLSLESASLCGVRVRRYSSSLVRAFRI